MADLDQPDLGTMQVFATVARHGGFAGAARATGLTRSAVGKAVGRLEARLGVRLLARSTRRTALTADGEAFLQRCEQILADVADAEASIRHDVAAPQGVLRLSLPDAYGRARILPIVESFLARWPSVTAEVSLSDRVADVVGEGLDLVVRIGGTDVSTGLIGRVIDRIGGVICAAPAYIDARGRPKTPQAFADHDRLVFAAGGVVMPFIVRAEDGAAIALAGRVRATFDSAEAIRNAALAGLGIAFLPSFLIADDLVCGDLVRLLPELATDEAPVRALYSARRHLPARTRLFLDLLSETLRQGI